MAKVKIILEDNETPDEVEALLFKALNSHVSGDQHTESFEDPAMIDMTHVLENTYEDIYKDMIDEVIQAIDAEYIDGY